MFTALQQLLAKIPRPWNYLVGIGLLVLLAILVFWLFGQIQACGYDKARKDYQEKETALKAERDGLLKQVAERDKQIAELEPKVAAYQAAAEQGKKVDDELSAKIDQVTKDAAEEAARTDVPTDCWVRGDRTCAKLRELRPPIVIDCDAYKRKVCSQ